MIVGNLIARSDALCDSQVEQDPIKGRICGGKILCCLEHRGLNAFKRISCKRQLHFLAVLDIVPAGEQSCIAVRGKHHGVHRQNRPAGRPSTRFSDC